MVPPITPGPHRFLHGAKHSSSRSVSSGTNPVHGFDVDPDLQNATPSAKRFSVPQQRSAGRRPASLPGPANTQTQSGVDYTDALRASFRSQSDILDANVATNETTLADRLEMMNTQNPCLDIDGDFEFAVPKRRKIDSTKPDSPLNSSRLFRQGFSPRTTHQDEHFERAAFLKAPSSSAFLASSISSSQAADATVSRTTFLRPGSSSSNTDLAVESPLPELFSPHRRGQKFVPGGMAATVQQWVIQVGQEVAFHQRREPTTANGVLKYRVEEVVSMISASEPCFVRASLMDEHGQSSEDHLVLVGTDSAMRGRQDIVPDSLLVVKPPTWTVENEGLSRLICVHWHIQSANT